MSDKCVICQGEDSEDMTIWVLVEPGVLVCFDDMLWTWTLQRDPNAAWCACVLSPSLATKENED